MIEHNVTEKPKREINIVINATGLDVIRHGLEQTRDLLQEICELCSSPEFKSFKAIVERATPWSN